MEKVWFIPTAEPPADLVFNENLPEASLRTFSIDAHLTGEELFVLPLPEFELGMIFSISVAPALDWEFTAPENPIFLTVSNREFFSGRSHRPAGEKLRKSFSPANRNSLYGRSLAAHICVYRL